MIVPIGDNELADAVDGDAGEAVELALAVAVRAELLQKVALRVEDLDAVVGRVCDDNVIIGTDGNAARPREVSRLAPPTPYLEQLVAFLQVLASRGSTCCCHRDTCKSTVNYITSIVC